MLSLRLICRSVCHRGGVGGILNALSETISGPLALPPSVTSSGLAAPSLLLSTLHSHARASSPYQETVFRSFAASTLQQPLPAAYRIGLHNLRDNPGARKQRIRVGRGDAARRGNYCGRGMKGKKARGRAHTLYDGGQLGLLKFPITRERPPYQVLYNHLGLSKLVNSIQQGQLDHTKVITMKDLYDSGCVAKTIKYGVMLYGKAVAKLAIPIHIEVTACDAETRNVIEAAGGRVTRVYYTGEGLKAHLDPKQYLSKRLPLPAPAHSWHPRYNGLFDAIGQIIPQKDIAAQLAASQGQVLVGNAAKESVRGSERKERRAQAV